MVVHLVKLPDVGEGVAEAELVEWYVAVGDEVAEDQILAAVMTDKATVEVPSPFRGRILEVGPPVGSMMSVGGTLVVIEGAGQSDGSSVEIENAYVALPSSDQAEKPVAAKAPTQSQKDPRPRPAEHEPPSTPRTAVGNGSHTTAMPWLGEKPLASPAVRMRARSLGLDLRTLRGSGSAGRISHADIDAFVSTGAATAAPLSLAYARRDGTEEVRITGLRRRIAERMAFANDRIVSFSYIEEIDLTAAEDLRSDLNARYADRNGKLTILPFILRALVLAVRDFPQMNARYDDENEVVVKHQAVHAGIATQTDDGLMVPVVVHAESLDLWQAAHEIKRLAMAARSRTATRDELSGSTISITSLGKWGGIATTPVINAPEVAIVGVNRLATRPHWNGQRFVPRLMMNLSSSFDHRVIDGYNAAQFIGRIKELLQQPSLLFIEA